MVALRAMIASVSEAANVANKSQSRTVNLPARKLTADSFRPFGQVHSLLKKRAFPCLTSVEAQQQEAVVSRSYQQMPMVSSLIRRMLSYS